MLIKKHFLQLALLASVTLLMAGCYPGGAEYISDTELVATDYRESYKDNFSQKSTYYIPDTIGFISNSDYTEAEIDNLTKKILPAVKAQMESRGYTYQDINSTPEPELIITVDVIVKLNSGVGWIPGYPGYPGWGYPGWGYPGWGWDWYYPPYWNTPVYYEYNTGSLVMVMGDVSEIEAVEEAEPVWYGALNRQLSSSSNSNVDFALRGIKQAFEQSPYIRSK